MRRYLVFSVLAAVVFLQGVLALPALAADSPQEINARILPTMWYSTLSVRDGDSLVVYGGVQNNSGTSFSGTAVFYVDGAEFGRVSYSSPSESLREISVRWKASAGIHSFQIKAVTGLSKDFRLISYESDVSRLTIDSSLTAAQIKDAAVGAVSSAVSKVVSSVLSSGSDIASGASAAAVDKLQSAKDSLVTRKGSVGPSGSVLGTTTSKVAAEGLGVLQFLLVHWGWTLIALVAIVALVWLRRRRSGSVGDFE
ncbi:MAG: hypothetical protein WC763_02565 [Candidatus Paceibacterota bacterium]|jgi:hypothetical protein